MRIDYAINMHTPHVSTYVELAKQARLLKVVIASYMGSTLMSNLKHGYKAAKGHSPIILKVVGMKV